MKHKKKKRSKASKPPAPASAKGKRAVSCYANVDSEEQKVLNGLMDAFNSVSLEAAVEEAYQEANGDPNRGAEFLSNLATNCSEDQTTSCSGSTEASGSCSSSSASEVFVVNHCGQNGVWLKSKPRKVIAATGTVSTVLSKDYVRSTAKKDSLKKKEFSDTAISKADAEQFLCSMLGEDCELSMTVIKDVLCQFGYDVGKALDVLLELSSPSSETLKFGECNNHGPNIGEQARCHLESSDNSTDRASDSSSHSSERDLQDDFWSMSNLSRNSYAQHFASYEGQSSTSPSTSNSEIPQKVLESLFSMPKSSEHELNSMNWRNVVKKMESLGRYESCLSDSPDSQQHNHAVAEGDEYRFFREAAKQHWDSMKIFYQKAATAYANGEREFAAYLSDQGRSYNKKAREADEKASQDIFQARNKSIDKVITIDLHGQHVKQATRLVKLHLLFGAYVRSVRTFRVITGCGTHGAGKSKVKQSVINLLEEEGIGWSEENRGTLLIRLNGQTEFSFLDYDSDSN